MATGAFLVGLLELLRGRLPAEQQGCETRQQWSLAKLWYDDPAIHYEVWVHRGRERVEMGLHFETRDAEHNQRMLDYVSDELFFLKAELGDGLEAEPWDRGWTRVYLTLPLEPLRSDYQARLAELFTHFVEVLEPVRRDAVRATLAGTTE